MTRALHGAAFLVVLAAVVAATRIESRPLRWVGVGEQPFDHRWGLRLLIVFVGLLLASFLMVVARRLSRPSKSPGAEDDMDRRRVIYGIAGAVLLGGIAYALSLPSKPVFSEGPVILSTNPPHDDQSGFRVLIVVAAVILAGLLVLLARAVNRASPSN
jgi:hypothetical protein